MTINYHLKTSTNALSKFVYTVFLLATLIACQAEAPSETSLEATPQSSSEVKKITDVAVPVPSATQEKLKYTELDTPIAVSTGEKIEIVELFWYGCGHCYALEPFVKTWLNDIPANAEFVKVPAIFSSGWSFHGQAYYTMEALGVLEQANDAFFNQIHSQQKKINDLPALVSFLSAYDKNEAEVTAAFNSFAVDTKLRNAVKITKSSNATGVPAFLVDGKYLTSPSMAGGQSANFDMVNELIKKAATQR